ncbi:DUF1659 domain-containing protein [Bacillus massilinigeriensis]|uniref:DUF1659 domain-containing protein n=1 Tax=Bacillus massilionigeriensis TaxID=1805475 RepID=UPI00096B4287|nr:DUF1659 domain-containing protein [Bacillus massilionigeriensis]
MAVEGIVKKALVLSFEEGVNEKGDPIIKKYTYSSVQTDAAPQKLADTATAISSLYKGTPLETTTVDTNILV